MFGAGVYTGNTLPSIKNGANNTKGQFYGKKYGSGNASISIFHIENLYGFVWKLTCGFINKNGKYLLKMTPNNKDGSTAEDYNTEGTGYIDVNLTYPSGTSAFIKEMTLFQGKGMLPKTTSGGSASTYYCDYSGYANVVADLRYGGSSYNGNGGGTFSLSVSLATSGHEWNCGVCLSYK